MEARGNGPSYTRQFVRSPCRNWWFAHRDSRGSDWVRGSLNWGPLTWINAVSKTFGSWHLRRGSYSKGFHTYSLEWTEDFMYALHHSLQLATVFSINHVALQSHLRRFPSSPYVHAEDGSQFLGSWWLSNRCPKRLRGHHSDKPLG
jgi:hypothetical protein